MYSICFVHSVFSLVCRPLNCMSHYINVIIAFIIHSINGLKNKQEKHACQPPRGNYKKGPRHGGYCGSQYTTISVKLQKCADTQNANISNVVNASSRK